MTENLHRQSMLLVLVLYTVSSFCVRLTCRVVRAVPSSPCLYVSSAAAALSPEPSTPTERRRTESLCTAGCSSTAWLSTEEPSSTFSPLLLPWPTAPCLSTDWPCLHYQSSSLSDSRVFKTYSVAVFLPAVCPEEAECGSLAKQLRFWPLSVCDRSYSGQAERERGIKGWRDVWAYGGDQVKNRANPD